MTIHVDRDALDRVAESLSRSASDLETIGAHLPGEPDAGIGTGPLLAIVALLLGETGHLVDGLAAAGGALQEANSSYSEQDRETADRLLLDQWGR